MKKSIIATGAASLALAAMPVAGVFAAYDAQNISGTVTDHLTVNIPASCTIQNANTSTGGQGDQTNPTLNNYYKVTMTNGEFKTDIGAANWDSEAAPSSAVANNQITVSCNTASDPSAQGGDPAGWVLTAIGAGTTDHTTDLWSGTAAIPTGTATQAGQTDVSAWAFKVVKGDGSNVSYDTDYTTGGNPVYTAVPASELDIANGAGSFAGGFTMTYQVYVSQTQAQGTYTGAVKYTLYNPAV